MLAKNPYGGVVVESVPIETLAVRHNARREGFGRPDLLSGLTGKAVSLRRLALSIRKVRGTGPGRLPACHAGGKDVLRALAGAGTKVMRHCRVCFATILRS